MRNGAPRRAHSGSFLPYDVRYRYVTRKQMQTEIIQQQLRRILDSRTFARAGRQARFLDYVVAKTSEGHAGELKEYVIATEVFERPHSYDPQLDSVVRVEASKLRTRLQKYYET